MSRRTGDHDWTNGREPDEIVLAEADHVGSAAILADPQPSPTPTDPMQRVHAGERPRRALPRRERSWAGRLCRS